MTVLLSLQSVAVAADNKSNVVTYSLGAMSGNVVQYFPAMEVVSIYPEVATGSAGNVYLYNNNKDAVNYVSENKLKHIDFFLRKAKELALKENARYYAVSNFTTKTVITENQVFIESWADIVALDKKKINNLLSIKKPGWTHKGGILCHKIYRWSF